MSSLIRIHHNVGLMTWPIYYYRSSLERSNFKLRVYTQYSALHKYRHKSRTTFIFMCFSLNYNSTIAAIVQSYIHYHIMLAYRFKENTVDENVFTFLWVTEGWKLTVNKVSCCPKWQCNTTEMLYLYLRSLAYI
jgi:hypothetical protein